MTLRMLDSVLQPNVKRHGSGLVTADLGGALGSELDPFIMVSLYEMAAPTFAPHPHAGFSVATYILPESPIGFLNQDTLGNRNRIGPGTLHVTVAGSGVQHEEQPERLGAVARGYQIWIDHGDAQREIAPHALHLAASDVPVVEREGATIRAVLGASNGVASPLSPPTKVRLIDVALEPNARFDQELQKREAAFLFILAGVVEISGARISAGQVALMGIDGETLSVSAHDGPARFTLFAGAPLQSRRVHGGPFVASSEAQLQRFTDRFRSGSFGALKPFAAQPNWTPND